MVLRINNYIITRRALLIYWLKYWFFLIWKQTLNLCNKKHLPMHFYKHFCNLCLYFRGKLNRSLCGVLQRIQIQRPVVMLMSAAKLCLNLTTIETRPQICQSSLRHDTWKMLLLEYAPFKFPDPKPICQSYFKNFDLLEKYYDIITVMVSRC